MRREKAAARSPVERTQQRQIRRGLSEQRLLSDVDEARRQLTADRGLVVATFGRLPPLRGHEARAARKYFSGIDPLSERQPREGEVRHGLKAAASGLRAGCGAQHKTHRGWPTRAPRAARAGRATRRGAARRSDRPRPAGQAPGGRRGGACIEEAKGDLGRRSGGCGGPPVWTSVNCGSSRVTSGFVSLLTG